MDTKYLFYITLIISIIVQIITGIIEAGAFFVKVPSIYTIITEYLLLYIILPVSNSIF